MPESTTTNHMDLDLDTTIPMEHSVPTVPSTLDVVLFEQLPVLLMIPFAPTITDTWIFFFTDRPNTLDRHYCTSNELKTDHGPVPGHNRTLGISGFVSWFLQVSACTSQLGL